MLNQNDDPERESPAETDAVKPPKRSYERDHFLSGRDLRASSLGWEIALPLVAGPLLGFFIDRRVGTGVLYTLIFLGLGLLFSVLSLVKFIRQEIKLMHKEEENKK